jgi:hypothetical protein
MNTAWVLRLVIVLALAAGGTWLVRNTEWVEVLEPVPLSDALRQDGTAAAQQLLQRLGMRTRRVEHLPSMPPTSATLVLAAPFWRLVLEDDAQLRRWVEAGGHLVVDELLLDDPTARVDWLPNLVPRTRSEDRPRQDWCRVLSQAEAAPLAFGEPTGFVACIAPQRAQQPHPQAIWWLASRELGLEAQRVPLGRGRVTAFSGVMAFDWQRGRLVDIGEGGAPRQQMLNFSNRGLLEGDNAALLAALVDARAGGEVWFLTRVERPALPLWLWQQAAPALLLAAAALALLLWRRGVRFGPLQAEPAARRRSLAAQVAGLADFLHHHQPAVLHAAALRALREQAARQLPGWARQSPAARTQALARATGLPEAALQRALEPQVARDGTAWTDTLALLETARRALIERTNLSDRSPR